MENSITTSTTPELGERLAAAIAQAGCYLGGIGFVWLPLILYFLAGKRPFLRRHAAQALKLQLALLLGILIGCILGAATDSTTLAIAVCVITAVPLLGCSVIGTVKAFSGDIFILPLVGK